MKLRQQPCDKDKAYCKVLDVSLTRSCNYNCSWCNQRYDITKPMHDMSESKRIIINSEMRKASEWIDGLNKFPYKKDYEKLIFSGGEPSLHPEFFDIVTGVKGYKAKIVITNLSFDVDKLVKSCRKNNGYLIVQPSFHFEFASFGSFIEKMKILDRHRLLSHFIPASLVDLPERKEPAEFKKVFKKNGYDVSLYKFEGYHKGEFIYADIEGFGSLGKKTSVYCSSAGHCVRPNGDMVFCPTDTYLRGIKQYGNICDKVYCEIEPRRICDNYGACHISCASWVKIESVKTGEVIWKGKNFLEKNMLNSLRNYCERKNYRWLSKIKKLYNTVSSFNKTNINESYPYKYR